MKRPIIFLLVLYSLPLVSRSQFNDSTHHHIRFSSTGVINQTTDGNSYVLNNSFDFNSKNEHLELNTNFGWIYGEVRHTLTNNDFTAHADLDLNKDRHKLYYWGLLNFDKSHSLQINYRYQAGLGAAYTIIKKTGLKLNISDGIIYEQGDIQLSDSVRDKYQVVRNSVRLSHSWSVGDRFSISGVHFYQPSITSISDYIIQSTGNLSVKLKNWLSIGASVVYNKVSRTKRENLLITYGFTMEKYF